MIGNVGVVLAFSSALVSGILFFRQAVVKNPLGVGKYNYALLFYHLHAFGLVLSTVYLFYALLNHQFQYYYVYIHSSLDLPLKYLVSAFWAGQEGTFILWALFVAAAGYLLLKREKTLLSAIMPFMLLGQSFLLFFLILENPFYHLGFIPADGMGLNPILMDPWMVIHPPVIFLGYALLTIPFAYAAAALWKKEWSTGFLKVLPWAVTGWLFLGAGILIGGAWAYRVLGWGGYWGWDPVENASLIPWLTATAMVHGLIAQKQKAVFIRSNLALSVITYVLIILASFLTRSGVMADYSVHAFTETTLAYFIALFLLVFLIIGLALFVWRYKVIAAKSPTGGLVSHQGSFSLTLVILSVSAVLVLLGTVSPIITGFFGNPASVGESFYLQTNTPLIFMLALILTICPLLSWNKKGLSSLPSIIKPVVILLPLGLIAGFLAGINTLTGQLFLAVVIVALLVNLFQFIRFLKIGIKYSGGYLAHVGLTMMLIGMLGSTAYTESQLISLKLNQPVAALGYQFTYLGIQSEDNYNYLQVEVDDGIAVFIARPAIYFVGERPMRTPGIRRSILKDLYISPVDLQLAEDVNQVTLAKDESIEIETYKITFKGFSFEQHAENNIIEVGALLEFESDGMVAEYMPTLKQELSGMISIPVTTDSGVTIAIDQIEADRGLVHLSVTGSDCCPEDEVFVAEIKIKPLISILISGTILLVLGSLIAVWRRFTD
jgi:cytochrome c-type biogenesis protein CcmF